MPLGKHATTRAIAMLAVAHLSVWIICELHGPHRPRLHVSFELKSPLSARVETIVGRRLHVDAELLARRRRGRRDGRRGKGWAVPGQARRGRGWRGRRVEKNIGSRANLASVRDGPARQPGVRDVRVAARILTRDTKVAEFPSRRLLHYAAVIPTVGRVEMIHLPLQIHRAVEGLLARVIRSRPWVAHPAIVCEV